MTHPRKDIRGYAEFIERVTGDAEDLWKTLGHESLLNSYEEYSEFLQGRKKATFLRFRNLRELPHHVPEKVISQVVGRERMPQMGIYINEKMAQMLMLAGGVENV